MSVYFDRFPRDAGEASADSRDEWRDKTSRVDGNDWSTARTTFYTDTDGYGNPLSSSKQAKFEQLKKHHGGFGEADRANTIKRTEVMCDTRAFCSILELPAFQRDRIERIMEDAEIDSNNSGGRCYEMIILAVISIVVDESIDSVEEIDRRAQRREAFQELMESVDMSVTELRRIRQMVRDTFDEFSD